MDELDTQILEPETAELMSRIEFILFRELHGTEALEDMSEILGSVAAGGYDTDVEEVEIG